LSARKRHTSNRDYARLAVAATQRVTRNRVHLTYISDANGGSTAVTVVTLLQDWSAQELTFCGPQTNQFPVNTVVTAYYTRGSTCSTLICVKINR